MPVPKGLTVVLNQPGKPLELETLPTPEVEPGGILIKNTAAAICGSDLHYWRNDGNYSGPDLRRVPGHEFTGVVASLGKGVATDSLRRPLKEGDRVTCPFFNPCNRCYWCMRGEHHACPHRQRRSMQYSLNEYPYCDGGYAEYYFLPPGHYVFKVPDILPDEAIPPVNCAMCQVLHGLEYAGMQFGDVVVIQGAGGLGIYAAAVAAEKGASKVISIDKQPLRLDFARKCGATDVIDMNELTTPEARELPRHQGDRAADQVDGADALQPMDHAERARSPGADEGQISALEGRLAQLPARGRQQGLRVRGMAGQEHRDGRDARDPQAVAFSASSQSGILGFSSRR